MHKKKGDLWVDNNEEKRVNMETLVKMQGITKEFPGVKALDNISFEIRAGEVHVLLGENGAGKSTLMKILSGVYQPTSGTITVKGKEFTHLTPKDSYEGGISIIYQELSVINELSILEKQHSVGKHTGTESVRNDPYVFLPLHFIHSIKNFRLGFRINRS